MKVTFVDGDDWEGVYIDGKLVTEGHCVRVDEVLKLLASTLSKSTPTTPGLRSKAACPRTWKT